jgi:hypothetical protein
MAGTATVRRSLLAVIVSLLLVATAATSIWLMASSGVFSLGGDGNLPGAPAGGANAEAAGGSAFPAVGGFHVLQPRDPFKPLVTQAPTTTTDGDATSTTGGETTSTTGGETTSTTGGETTSTTGGETTSTTGGATTTTSSSTTSTTEGDTPDQTRVTLHEIRDESGVRKAVVEVDGETFTVGVGDTFAEDFKVVSLTDDSGVFMYRDNVFTLAVGQSILK